MSESVFEVVSDFQPTGDQPEAIDSLLSGLNQGLKRQTLLGVTGSGKTFTMANVIEKWGRPTLVLAPNRTLAAQLCSEFKEFFPHNAVEYFVSYYDYYQPEAYIPRTDTYIAKDADINDEIDKLRHAATRALFTRKDVIIVASVSCIYGLGDEVERIIEIDPLTGELLAERDQIDVFPAKHFVTSKDKLELAIDAIGEELEERLAEFREAGRLLEASRLEERTRYDIESMREAGYCSGIENYSRHLAGRAPGSTPWTLLDYFPDDWLMTIDESHVAIPQVRGMFHGDLARKTTLVDYGFRLPSAIDNRPLNF